MPPVDEKLFFKTYCLAHYMAYTEMTESLSKLINCSPMELSRVEHSSREIQMLIRSKLRTLAHLEKVKRGKCTICERWISKIPLPTSTTPCCSKVVHEACWNDPYKCLCCNEPVNFLSCVVCKESIEYFGPPLEGYEFYSSLRLKCCGADIHQLCREQLLSNVLPSCCLCNSPLKSDGSPDARGPGDIFHSRKQALWNVDLRRKREKHHSAFLKQFRW